MQREIYKWYRLDKDLWEQKIVLFWFITVYRYSIWRMGKTTVKYRLLKYKNPEYLKKAIKTEIYVGKKEFEEKYKNNKYLVPINYVLDLNRE